LGEVEVERGGKVVTKKETLVPAIKVNQWLPEWDRIHFDSKSGQAKPKPYFLLFSMKAAELKALTGVYRRTTKNSLARAKDPNVQRGHDEGRSLIIREFVKFGFPWCEMSDSGRNGPNAKGLQKPGWLPTAIVVNILPGDAKRNNKQISKADAIRVSEEGSVAQLHLPQSFGGADWEPETVYPLEVIDGQHRLWAFDGFDPADSFELPVVAFLDLDRSWQAYLFWSINITPKRINKSLAFDLYPLLRREDWLDFFEGHSIYRETRCQELVEALWSSEASAWHQRINMLGERKGDRESKAPMVSQAAWIRSLMATFVKQWEGSGSRIGGLFGASKNDDDLLLPWNRPMQAALLLLAGSILRDAVKSSRAKWAVHLRNLTYEGLEKGDDPAFYGDYSLFVTDQGIRGYLFVLNDLLYVSAEELELRDWTWEDVFRTKAAKRYAAVEEEAQALALSSLRAQKHIVGFIEELNESLCSYDWRTSSTPDLSEPERLERAVFRGSGGYKELRKQLLQHIGSRRGNVGKAAVKVATVLGY
jgi:DGQHR domain-containing protein